MFTLTEQALETAFKRSRLEPRTGGAVLFGIRGATPAGAGSGRLQPEQTLVSTVPDYVRPRCTLGYWKPGRGLAVFPGSTVPNLRYVKKALGDRGEGTNQLCFGLHRGYRKGRHNSANARFGHRALRMDRAIPVQRTGDDLDYDADDRLEFETAYDNIHCGWATGPESPGFSSAGCQVVVGSANPETGAWKAFASLVYGDQQLEFDYGLFSGGELRRSAEAGGEPLPLSLRFGSTGDEVAAVQEALTAHGYSTAGVDGDFGWRTLLAVFRFQRDAMGQRVPDGVVGAQTLAALDLDAVSQDRPSETAPPGVARVETRAPEPAVAFVYRTEPSDGGRILHHYASADDHTFYLGYVTKPKGALKIGLAQSSRRLAPAGAAFYDRTQHIDDVGVWADLIVPTATVESGLCFECLNTYDRAAFTFGLMQCAAHIPDDNFLLLFKDLLATPQGRAYFPDLILKPGPRGPRLYQRRPSEDLDLEVAEPRGGGSQELNLKRFMAYLNPSLEAVEPSELSAAARMMHWTRTVEACRRLQVDHAVRALKARMAQVRTALVGRPIDQCLAAADIRYQGRGGPQAIRRALETSRPLDALLSIGAEGHPERVKRLGQELGKLMKRPELARLRFDPSRPELFS